MRISESDVVVHFAANIDDFLSIIQGNVKIRQIEANSGRIKVIPFEEIISVGSFPVVQLVTLKIF